MTGLEGLCACREITGDTNVMAFVSFSRNVFLGRNDCIPEVGKNERTFCFVHYDFYNEILTYDTEDLIE